jgi:hypothetical protein
MSSKPNLVSLCGIADDAIEADLSGLGLDADDAAVLASELPDKGALSSLNLASNAILSKESGRALADALKTNSVLTELDLSDNQDRYPSGNIKGSLDGTGFAKELAVGISDNGALSCANVLKNGIDADQANALVSILKEHPTLKSLCGNKGDETELDMSGKMYGAGDAIMLVPELIDNGALTSLDLSSNSLGQPSDLPEGWSEPNPGNPDYRFEHTDGRHQAAPPEGSKFESIIALGDAIKDMEALSIANVMGNKIGKEQLAKLQEIMRAKPSLVSLCGIADGATEADLSGLGMDADDAAILASELPDKGAMTSLNLAGNWLEAEGAKHIAGAIKVSKYVLAVI